MHHIPCFSLFILRNNSFDNQGSDINKNGSFLRTVFYENFLPTTIGIKDIRYIICMA